MLVKRCLSLIRAKNSYKDYRRYLRDLIAGEMAQDAKLSLSWFAKSFGMTRSSLAMILSGERNLTIKGIVRICLALRLPDSDQMWFETLVHFTQARSPEEKAYFTRRLTDRGGTAAPIAISTPSTALTSQWYVPAILTWMLDFGYQRADLPAMASQIGVPEAEISEVIEALRREGFLELAKRGKVHVAFNRIATVVSTKKFFREVCLEGVRRIEKSFEDRQNLFTAHTFTVSPVNLGQLVQDYKALLDRYISMDTAHEPGRLCMQMNTQLFKVLGNDSHSD